MALDFGHRGNDFVVLAMSLFGGSVLMLSGPAAYQDWPWVKQYSGAMEILVVVAATAFGIWFLWIAAAHAARLFNAAPDALFDASGVTLKPYMAPRPLAWPEITGLRIRRKRWRGPTIWLLDLYLAAPLRTLESGFLPTRKIVLASHNGRDIIEAARIVQHYRRMAAGFKR
jgi:hypothetical protein